MEQKETTLKKYETPQMEVLDIGPQLTLCDSGPVEIEGGDDY